MEHTEIKAKIEETIKKIEAGIQRILTIKEKKLVVSWVDMGFEFETIKFAIELTYEMTDRVNFNYTNKILVNWWMEGYRTLDEVKAAVEPKKKPQTEIKVIQEFADLDLRQQYTILQNAKELLAFLNTAEDFPYMDAYYDGTAGLQKAMAYIDDKILHTEEN